MADYTEHMDEGDLVYAGAGVWYKCVIVNGSKEWKSFDADDPGKPDWKPETMCPNECHYCGDFYPGFKGPWKMAFQETEVWTCLSCEGQNQVPIPAKPNPAEYIKSQMSEEFKSLGMWAPSVSNKPAVDTTTYEEWVKDKWFDAEVEIPKGWWAAYLPTCACLGPYGNGSCEAKVLYEGTVCQACIKGCGDMQLKKSPEKKYPCSCPDNSNEEDEVGVKGCSHGFLVEREGWVCDYCNTGHQVKQLLFTAPRKKMNAYAIMEYLQGKAKQEKEQKDGPSLSSFIDYYTDAGDSPYYLGTKKMKKPKRKRHELPKYLRGIGLDEKFDIGAACANFFLLERMATYWKGRETDVPAPDFTLMEKAEKALQEVETVVAKQMSLYLDMACGGELRYCATAGDPGCAYHGKIAFSDPQMAAYLKKVKDQDRMKAWEVWMRLRRAKPKKSLHMVRLMVAIFEEKTGWGRKDTGEDTSVGGAAWAKVARVLSWYLHGTMKPRHFVNMAFSLQHNNSNVFDKLWDTQKLNRVLRVQYDNEYDHLSAYADEYVQTMWNFFKTKLRGGDRT